MLNNTNSHSDFKKLFKIKFNNFLRSFPLFLSYYMSESYVDVFRIVDKKNNKKENLFRYDFDFSKDVKSNIYKIRQLLLMYCPKMKQRIIKQEEYTSKELNNLISEDKISIYEIDTLKKNVEEVIHWRIEKVNPLRDRCIIRNLITDDLYNYNFIKMPCIVFLNTIIYKDYNEEEIADLFFEKTKLYSIIKNK